MAPDKTDALPIGTELAGHRIVELIGSGGFGKTYRVESLRDGSTWALKEFFPREIVSRNHDTLEIVPHDNERRVFDTGYRSLDNEAHLLRDMPPHKNIVRVKGLFKKHNTIYMLMEFINGVSLKAYLDSGQQIPERDLVRTLGMIADGLEHMHDKKVLHRDVKPENIMVNQKGIPVLIDFGAARLTQNKRNTHIYTKPYAALEQWPQANRLGLIEGSYTDIYALGVVAYEFVTGGHRPPESWQRFKALEEEGKDPFVSCSRRLSGDYSRRLCDAVDWALELMPRDRPGRATDWVERMRSDSVAEHSVHENWLPPKMDINAAIIAVRTPRPKAREHRPPVTQDEGQSSELDGSMFEDSDGDAGYLGSKASGSLSSVWVLVVLGAIILAVIGITIWQMA